MNFRDAWANANDGDIVILNDGDFQMRIKKHSINTSEVLSGTLGVASALSKLWFVEPEPVKAKTADDYISEIKPVAEFRNGTGCVYNHDDMRFMFSAGRIVERLKHRELWDLMKGWVKSFRGAIPRDGLISRVVDVLKKMEQQ